MANADDHIERLKPCWPLPIVSWNSRTTKGARRTLDDLIAKYPGTEAAQTAKDRQSRLR